MNWPTEIHCHDANTPEPFRVAGLWPHTWRPANLQSPDDGGVTTFRTCSYCGSIHPEDLLQAVAQGAVTMEVADWKYGWPHKVYVHGIPNPNAGNFVCKSYRSGPGKLTEMELDVIRAQVPAGGHIKVVQNDIRHEIRTMEPDAPTTWAKWYNIHLTELDDEAFAAMAAVLKAKTGITWNKDPVKGVGYAAAQPGGAC